MGAGPIDVHALEGAGIVDRAMRSSRNSRVGRTRRSFGRRAEHNRARNNRLTRRRCQPMMGPQEQMEPCGMNLPSEYVLGEHVRASPRTVANDSAGGPGLNVVLPDGTL